MAAIRQSPARAANQSCQSSRGMCGVVNQRAPVQLAGLPAKPIRFPARAVVASLDNDLRTLGRHHREQAIRIGASQRLDPVARARPAAAASTIPGQILSSISVVVTAIKIAPATPTASRRGIDHSPACPARLGTSPALDRRVFRRVGQDSSAAIPSLGRPARVKQRTIESKLKNP